LHSADNLENASASMVKHWYVVFGTFASQDEAAEASVHNLSSL